MASPLAPPPPSSSHQPKPLFDLEITVVSAKHLKNVNWRNGDLKPYAVAYLDPDRRSATKPDDSGSTSPVWNERLSLPIPLLSSSSSSPLFLTLDIFHSKPSETPKPLVATARVPLADLVDLDSPHPPSAGPAPIKALALRRPSGRPQGKLRIKIALCERPLPPPPPPHSHPLPSYYYATPPRDYRSFSPPPPPPPLPHYTNPIPPPHYPYFDPYTSGYSSSIAGYYSAPPAPAPAPAPPPPARLYYDRPPVYGGPSAPMDYSSSYEHRVKEGRMGMGAGLAVGAVAGAMGGLALGEGIKYEEEKVAERVENDLASRDDYSDYRADY